MGGARGGGARSANLSPRTYCADGGFIESPGVGLGAGVGVPGHRHIGENQISGSRDASTDGKVIGGGLEEEAGIESGIDRLLNGRRVRRLADRVIQREHSHCGSDREAADEGAIADGVLNNAAAVLDIGCPGWG